MSYFLTAALKCSITLLFNNFKSCGALNQLTNSPMSFTASLETERHLQKSALSKQREDYIKKAAILKKEMDTLKDQRNELRGDPKRSPSPDTKRFLKENTKLQVCRRCIMEINFVKFTFNLLSVV